ncbi:MAG: quinol:electron acceptor oxidoreductase subunit ActD [Planctomycetota bacterium]
MTSDKKLYGVLGQYEDVTTLYRAAEKVRDAGYKDWDCHTPFPVHGLDDAMGIKFTRLPWVVLAMGLTGLFLGGLLQWWTNAVDYTYDISGKPVWSLPANIPVIFEVTVLFSAFTTFFTMWIFNGLPRWYHPLLRNERFARATDDKFFIAIHADDKNFDQGRATSLLEGAGATAIEEVHEANESSTLPKSLKGGIWVLVCLAFVPIAMVYSSYGETTTKTRVHLVPDMDKQDRFRPQGQVEGLFADGRMTRAQVAGTVGRDQRDINSPLHTGKSGGQLVKSIPAGLTVDEKFLDRGRERFEIFCGICHGDDGKGKGTVHQRAMKLADQGHATWVPPTDVTAQLISSQDDGYLFETISEGRRTMPAYASQISPEDRWAIIAYMRVLQAEAASHGPSAEEVSAMSPAERGEKLFTDKICVTCHAIDDSAGAPAIGPPLMGLLGSEVKLDTGETLVIDEAYIIESIKDPAAKTREGALKGAMPPLGAGITDEEIQDIIEYLKTKN